jgi:hypothetical protein
LRCRASVRRGVGLILDEGLGRCSRRAVALPIGIRWGR